MNATLDDALTLQREVGLFDLHLDSILQNRLFGYDIARRHRPGIAGQPLFWHADLPRMREGAYGGACMGIHGWPRESEARWEEMLRQIAVVDALCAAHDDLRRVHHNGAWSDVEPGKICLMAGVEGAHMLNRRVDRVAELAKRGVAYLTLVHLAPNSAGTPGMGPGSNERDGLTPFGRDLVRALNDYGIAIDVSHLNQRGVLEVCALSRAPVFATHSGAQRINPHPRLLSEEALDAVRETGGVVGVIFAPNFLAGRIRKRSDVVVDHIEYLLDRLGEDHVAIGTDYDGWLPSIPTDMRDCRDAVVVTRQLLQRGHSAQVIRKVLRHNATAGLRAIYDKRAYDVAA